MKQEAPTDAPKSVEEDVSAEVADAVAASEEAAPEEDIEEETEAEPEEPAVPSPITRDMYVRLVQEFADKDKGSDQTFHDGLSRVNTYRSRMVHRLFLARARNQIEQDHAMTDDVETELSTRRASAASARLTCDVCKEAKEIFHHCVVCNDDNYDICQACVDKGNKCPGNHPLYKFIKPTEDATAEAWPEHESIFPISEPLEDFDVDDHKFIIRTLYLAALLGEHDDIVSQIVQYGLDSDTAVNEPLDSGTTRIWLTPLALAVLVGGDDDASSLLNAEPNMLVFRNTVYPVEEEQEETLEETEQMREEMGDETATQKESNVEAEVPEAAAGEASDDDASTEYETVSEATAIDAITLAVMHGTAQSVKFLLIQWDENPLPPSHMLLHDAVEYGLCENIDTLINWGVDTEETSFYYNRTPLIHAAVKNVDISKIDALIRRRANVSAQDDCMSTAMHYGATNNRLDIVQMLVDAGANTEVEDKNGNTPIHFVVDKPEYYALAKYLVQKGTSLKHKNKEGQDPLDIAGNSSADNGETYLILAVSLTTSIYGARNSPDWLNRVARFPGGGVRISKVRSKYIQYTLSMSVSLFILGGWDDFQL